MSPAGVRNRLVTSRNSIVGGPSERALVRVATSEITLAITPLRRGRSDAVAGVATMVRHDLHEVTVVALLCD